MPNGSLETEAEVLARVGSQLPEIELPTRFQPRHLTLQLHVTERCNLVCRHCYQDAGLQSEEMDTKAVLDSLLQFTRLLQQFDVAGHVNFTGGEPFIRDDFWTILEQAASLKDSPGFSVLTNGTMLGELSVRKLRELCCRFVQLSLEGSEATHDSIRGEGNFQLSLQALRLLKGAGLKSMVSFTASRLNQTDFGSVVECAAKAGAGIIWSDRLLPVGRGSDFAGELFSSQELISFFEDMYLWRRRLRSRLFSRSRVRMHRALQFLVLSVHEPAQTHVYRCNAGRGLLAVLPDGRVLPCRRMPVVVGNLAEQSLVEIYSQSKLLQLLRANFIPVACRNCSWRFGCAGGLRCLAYACSGNPFGADPQCPLSGENGAI